MMLRFSMPLVCLVCTFTVAQTSQPAVEVTPEAKVLLDRVNAAYLQAQSKPVTNAATITGEFDIAGRSKKYEMKVYGFADGKGHFDHRVKDIGRVVQTEDRLIVYDAVRNSFGTLMQNPAIRKPIDVVDAVTDVLIDENPSLLMLISNEPVELLKRGAQRISTRDDKLVIESDEDVREIEIGSDDMITAVTLDYSPVLKSRMAEGIKIARVRLVYVPTDLPDQPKDLYLFALPDGSTEFRLQAELMKAPTPGLRRDPKPTSLPTTSE